MTKQTKGFILMTVAILMMIGIAGAVEFMSPDAGYIEWASVLLSLICPAVVGLLGFSYMQEANDE